MAKKDNAKHTKAAAVNGTRQSFSLVAPTATRVQLTGDFTDWQQWPLDMDQGEDGIWRVIVELPPGTHQYRFLVNGQSREDAQSRLRVRDTFWKGPVGFC